MFVILLWVIFGLLSFGILGINFALLRRAAIKPWRLKIDKSYLPKVTILVPTYNESDVIRFKLENLRKLDYPKELLQLIIVDSNSTDNTFDVAADFAQRYQELNIKVLKETKREGKSAALNSALSHANGELIIVSDADCFYPNDILRKSVPYMSDPKVGAISGPKLLLNCEHSEIVKNEERYLKSMNYAKLGESKLGFTPLFEGGFSAYRRDDLASFDPYKTGSDDCGTVIKLAESATGALLIPEAAFFTTFPLKWTERFGIKIRRGNQLIRVFSKYLSLFLRGRLNYGKRVILTNVFTYLFSPFFFVSFLVLTVVAFLTYPYLALLMLLFLIPNMRALSVEVFQSYFVLFFSVLAVIFKKNFLIWKQPADRHL
ncbi:glycosyltransferase, partial [Candidatus Bathyarchaeota archaeon]|nr:glycosyltransferase [Candidatus Bathyarchaeota archaeon]